jgi:hypothetical protein
MLAFLDVTRWLSLLLFATVPLVLLMRSGRSHAEPLEEPTTPIQ